MKQFIVLMATIALGLFLYACIAGPENSVTESLSRLWQHDLAQHPYRGDAA